jgi:acyl-CoA synthetase (NDP forming)
MTGRTLSEHDSRDRLEPHGVVFGPSALVRTEDELASALERLAFPLVIKVASEAIAHKSDIGGVIVGVDSPEAALAAYREVLARGHGAVGAELVDGVSVQEMVSGVAEVALGAKRTDVFGPVILLGGGGVLIELLNDVSLRVCPITREDAAEMLDELSTAPLLAGYRGRPEADRDALLDLAVALSDAMLADDAIAEVDLNPVLVREQGRGAVAVDALVRLVDDADAVEEETR